MVKIVESGAKVPGKRITLRKEKKNNKIGEGKNGRKERDNVIFTSGILEIGQVSASLIHLIQNIVAGFIYHPVGSGNDRMS
jgi:hypothetical protein